MKSSLLYQVVNAASGVLVLVFILVNFDQNQYLQWILFSTIGGIAIQLEGSVGAISSRHLSRHAHGGFAAAVQHVASLYRRFAFTLFVAMIVAGGTYLRVVDSGRFSRAWFLEWAIMCGGYLATYLFAHNYCTLIAEGRLGRFATVNLIARMSYILMALSLLSAGVGVLGLSCAFFASAVIGSVLFRLSVSPEATATHSPIADLEPARRDVSLRMTHVIYHCLFMSAAYALYRYALLIAALDNDGTGVAASFGLALQFLALVSTVASAPVNLRVAPMVSAVRAGDGQAVVNDLALSLLVSNAIYIAGFLALVLFGHELLQFLPKRGVDLPSITSLLLLAVAGLVEINIFVMVNVLVAAQRFGFVAIYVVACCGYWVAGALIFWGGSAFLPVYVGMVAAIQACVVLPMILRLVAEQLHRHAYVLFGDLSSAAGARIRLLVRGSPT